MSRRFPLVVALALGARACVAAPGAAPTPEPALEGELVAPERIAALVPAPERDAWLRYLEASRRQRELDRASIAAELELLGRERWTPASEGPAFHVTDEMTGEWFRSEEARRLAESILSYQTPSGGWSKRVDLRQPRQLGESYSSASGWSYIATFDNDATTEHLRFLAEAYRAAEQARYREGFLKGLEYIFRAQYPNGCWPQVYPLQGSYHDAATYNDEATTNILRLLRSVASGEDDLVPEPVRRRAQASLRQGIECVLASQVVVDGRRTVWGAQHDPLTLQPVKARAYEHASLSGGESTDIVEFLMSLRDPEPREVDAVHAAAAWFRETAIYGFEYRHPQLTAKEGAGPIWARFYEVGTNRPIFSNRDGVVLYDWHDLEEERRRGYAWFRTSAADVLRRYEAWARRHPVPTQPPASGNSELLAPGRIPALPAADRAAWQRYIEISARHGERDRKSMEAELAALGRERWTAAPAARGRVLREPKPPEWFRGDEARRIGDIVLSYQTLSGGWSKNVDYRRSPRQPGQSYYSSQSWSYIGTFDNDATTDEMRFLAHVQAQPQTLATAMRFGAGSTISSALNFPTAAGRRSIRSRAANTMPPPSTTRRCRTSTTCCAMSSRERSGSSPSGCGGRRRASSPVSSGS